MVLRDIAFHIQVMLDYSLALPRMQPHLVQLLVFEGPIVECGLFQFFFGME